MSINIKPEIWGPSAWKFMHYITLSYPDNPTNEDKVNVRNFFTSCQQLLPCDKCKKEFKKYLDNIPLNDNILKSRYELSNWLLNIHNKVNNNLNKPSITYDEMINIYMNNKKTEPFSTIKSENNSEINSEIKSEINSENYTLSLLNSIVNIDTTILTTICIFILILILILVIRIRNM